MNAPPRLVDRRLLARRRQRAVRLGAGPHFLVERATAEVADRLAVVSRDFPRALALGDRGGLVADALSALPGIGGVVSADSLVAATGGRGAVVVDEEALPFAPGSLSLVVSVLGLHQVNDLPGALLQIRRALAPDGLLLAVVPCGDTLHELRDVLIWAETELSGGAHARVLPMAPLQTLAGLLQRAGFALPVADVERLTIRYRDLAGLVADIRALGDQSALAARAPGIPPRRLFEVAERIYRERYADPDGRLRATVDLAHLSGWAPHESQQKPLRPGSARQRLADALGTSEMSAGEAAPGGVPRRQGGAGRGDP